ncbi:MAG TPA: DUF4192 domain-containing protein [Jatrophihabitans sp.]|nr:DUF4192 domain-containing protein [Jatrophihabitans sp.]
MSSCELPQIQVASPGELIETVPYLMGFHPIESLTLVGFSCRFGRPHRVTVTVRVDLPDRPDQLGDLSALTAAFQTSCTDAVVVILHTDRFTGDPRARPELRELQDRVGCGLRGLELEVIDVLVANADRWWSMCCEQPECCPAEGTSRSSHSSAVAATATFAGLVAFPDRQALAESLTGSAPTERATLAPLLAEARAGRIGADDRVAQRADSAAILDAARRYPAELATITDDELAWFGVALTEPPVRDLVWLAIDARAVDATPLLHLLHTRLPEEYALTPLFLYGWAQWRAGSGTLALMAAEQVLAVDPGYSAARLLVEAVRRGLDPQRTPALSDLPRSGRRRSGRS